MEKILIVDDEKEYLKVFGMIFDNEGYGVLTASSGEEAIGKYKKYSPGLLIIDHHMPGLNGLETIERIKKINNKCIFIMISGLMNIDLFKKAEKIGVRYCFPKPVKLYEIKKTIKEIFNKKSVYGDLEENNMKFKAFDMNLAEASKQASKQARRRRKVTH